MNSNYHLNSYKNFNSNYFQLIPSKFVTFGIEPLNKINSSLSDSQSNKYNNNIIFEQIPNKFKLDSDNYDKNNSLLKENITNQKKSNKGILSKNEIPIYFNNSFQIGSKTVLNSMNTCLLDLFSPIKNNSKHNLEYNEYTSKTNFKKINLLNEETLSDIKENNNDKNSYSIEKIKFSPIKGIKIAQIENKNENTNRTKNSKLIEINNENKNKTKLLNKPNDKFLGAFKLMNNNYENPAKNKIKSFDDTIIFDQVPGITKISNITNITNNYYFQCDNSMNLLKRKTKRIQNKDMIESSSKKKIKDNNNMNIKIKKENNLSYGLYQLNQISVNGVSISKFPVVSMNEDDLEVLLLSKMLTETDYFTIVDKYYINIPVLDEEKYNKPFYDKIFKKEKEKISNLYLIGDNLNENNPISLIRNFYCQIKEKILNIQKNYLSDNKKAVFLNIELCNELEKLIISCNAITNTVTDYKKSGLKRKLFLEHNNSEEDEKSKMNNNLIGKEIENNKNEINKCNKIIDNKNTEDNNNGTDNNLNDKNKKIKRKHFKTYLCEFCNKAYSNGQGLGGHMSRIHPNQSYKYKDKIRIRREREKKREKLLIIKQDLFKKYGYNYDKLVKEKNKSFIQQFLLVHNEEYKNIRKNQKKENKNNENISENENENGNNDLKNIFVTPLPAKMTNIYKRKIDCEENIIKNILSKEKTNDKTELKKYEMENSKVKEINDNKIDFVAKLKINFSK